MSQNSEELKRKVGKILTLQRLGIGWGHEISTLIVMKQGPMHLGLLQRNVSCALGPWLNAKGDYSLSLELGAATKRCSGS